MREWTGKRYWLVGASEGLGRAVAEALSHAGAEVIVSARSEAKLRELAQSLPGPAHAVQVDVSDPASVASAAQQIGQIDGLIYLAGVYWPQSALDWDPEQVEMMCDINLTGAARCIGAVMPQFKAAGVGHIVLTGSLSGFRGLPGAIGYCASKAGLMSLAESMYADLRTTGIDVQCINPGFIRTRLTEKNDFQMPFIMDPDQAAKIFVSHMGGKKFKRSFPTLFSWVFRGSQLLPDWLYFRVFS
jgi:NAD(P)-dependent dehydrogenase (short-subunit alcohol dehydrogenase family)